MQGRSLGSKRFKEGKAAPQPTRASIYQEENTPLDWHGAHDLRAQLAVPQRRAEPHSRALRHGLIASQLGLPMLARTRQEQAPEAWELPAEESAWSAEAHAAQSGEQQVGLDWSNNEQTTRYDEWELQKELVTYAQTYRGYDPEEEHPRLDLQLPPIAAGYEAELSQHHELIPDQAQAAYTAAEYARPQATFVPDAHAGQTRSARSQPYAAGTAPHTATQVSIAPHAHAAYQGRVTHSQLAAASAKPRTATEASFAVQRHATHAQHRSAGAEPRSASQESFAVQPHATTQHRAAGAEPRTATRSQLGTGGGEPRAATQANPAAQVRAVHAQLGAEPQAHAALARTARAPGGARTRAPAPKLAVRRYGDDEPVVYPHNRGWLKRIGLLLVLAGAGYAAHRYVQRAPVPAPTPPPPPAATFTPVEPPAPTIEPAETTPKASPEQTLSAKERRLAARAALLAERRERRAARRGRDEDSPIDDSDPPSSRSRSRTSSTNATMGDTHDASRSRSYAHASDVPDSYATNTTRAQDDYVSERHAAAQSGVLRINTLPWSQVYIDGQLVGHTPQTNLLLSAGKHRITLVNNEMQLSKSLTVHITAGITTTHKINLAE